MVRSPGSGLGGERREAGGPLLCLLSASISCTLPPHLQPGLGAREPHTPRADAPPGERIREKSRAEIPLRLTLTEPTTCAGRGHVGPCFGSLSKQEFQMGSVGYRRAPQLATK